MTKDTNSSKWIVYIAECADSTLYTGITNDLTKRIHEHNSSTKGARYTRPRRPVTCIYNEVVESRSIASKREHVIKSLTRVQKLALIHSK